MYKALLRIVLMRFSDMTFPFVRDSQAFLYKGVKTTFYKPNYGYCI